MRPWILLAATAAALTAAAPAAAGPKYFFICAGAQPATKVQNTQAKDWSTTVPAASYTTGAGCGSADPGLLQNRFANADMDFIGGGTHTGPIGSVNVELHSLVLSQARVPADMGVELDLTVDGESVTGEILGTRITPETSQSGLSQKFVFSIARKKLAGQTVADPLVTGDGPHTVSLRFSSQYLDYQNAWAWGATEIPANMEIDPVKLASPKVTF